MISVKKHFFSAARACDARIHVRMMMCAAEFSSEKYKTIALCIVNILPLPASDELHYS